MRRKKDSAYETRADLLERIRRQKESIQQLMLEREDLRYKLASYAHYQTDNAMLRERARLANAQADGVARLVAAVRALRKAIHNTTTGDLVGGANQRRALADADDLAIQALSALACGEAGNTKQKEQK